MAEKAINEALLEGLTFRTSKEVKTKGEGGKEVKEIQKIIRPLQPGDVLDWSEKNGVTTIVTKDGKKHKVNNKKK